MRGEEVTLSLRRTCSAALLLLSPQGTRKKIMRCLYRETMHKCGEKYLEVDIYPVYEKQKGRGPRRKPTSEVQERLNQRNSERKLVRLLNTNFTNRDIRFDLTYADKHLPDTPDEALRELQNFFRRVKRARAKLLLPELKYIAVTEYGEEEGRIHHHLIMSGGVDITILAELWGRGYTTAKPLQFDDEGIIGLAVYLTKESALKKRWSCSRNLKRPEVKQRDGKISAHRVTEWLTEGIDRNAVEAMYPGYRLVKSNTYLNEVNFGVYTTIHLVKEKETKCLQKKKSNYAVHVRKKPKQRE